MIAYKQKRRRLLPSPFLSRSGCHVKGRRWRPWFSRSKIAAPKEKRHPKGCLFSFGASGDTELFEKASNINGFQGGRVANNLNISPFRATVFKTAALFLYPNSSVVIRAENLLFHSLWLAFRTGRRCFPMWEAAEACRRTNPPKINTFHFHRKEVRRWLYSVSKRPGITR